MANEPLDGLLSTKWAGNGELWLDKRQNAALASACRLEIDSGVIRYHWSYEGKPQQGGITLQADGFDWHDSRHQPKTVRCREVAGAWGLLCGFYSYPAGDGPDWGRA
jgi:hypothetical protein